MNVKTADAIAAIKNEAVVKSHSHMKQLYESIGNLLLDLENHRLDGAAMQADIICRIVKFLNKP